ncbi:MAG: nrfD [Firmicutes bacterium]|nr:nrfD [Bacillota bacterium]
MEQKQGYWGWLAAGYLFLAALGAMIVSTVAIMDILDIKVVSQINGWISLVALVLAGVGSLFLMVELTHIFRAYLIYARPSSIMCIGSYLLTAFLGLTFIYATFFFDFIPWAGLVVIRKIVAVLTIVSALGLVAYPGLELAEARGRTFWNGGGLVALFITNGAATGLAGVNIMLVLFGLGVSQYVMVLNLILTITLIIQLTMISSYLWGIKLTGAKEAQASVASLVTGTYRFKFMGIVVSIGTVVPLILGFFGSLPQLVVVAAVLVLVGGLLFRRVFLAVALRIVMPGEENQTISDKEAAQLAIRLEKCWAQKAGWLKN